MVSLSKSKYCKVWQCPKSAWLSKYKPELAIIDESAKDRMQTGNEVGDLAMGLFGDFIEVTSYKEDSSLDLSRMIATTAEEMNKGTEVICEASFSYEGLYCAVDILKKENGGYAIYEVKSSSTDMDELDINPIYIADISYQKYVLEHCGVNVTGTYLITLNKKYVLNGDLDLSGLFNIIDVSQEVSVEIANVEGILSVAEETLSSDEEPATRLAAHCEKPYKCAFQQYCMRDIPNPSVFDLYHMSFKKKAEFYYNGIVSYEDLSKCDKIKNETHLRQIDFYLNNREPHIDKAKIKDFLDTLSYPLYFLDFESMKSAIPVYQGTKPNQQIPFQYSLHFILEEGGELQHKEFLAQADENPLRPIAEALCRDIPRDVCVTAFNKSFECGRLEELAALFPDLSEHLLNIESNMKDFLVPFRSGYYYNKAMGGSFSIKSVLPALFPDDPALDYHNLEGIHNGGEAMTIFPKMKHMSEEEQKQTRNNLLKYCELDTYAMVKVWEKLVDAAK